MKIHQIQIINKLISLLKLGLCTDIDTFFLLKDSKKKLMEIIKGYENFIETVMHDHNITPTELPSGDIKYIYEGHNEEFIIAKKIADMNNKEFEIDMIDISKIDYKNITVDLNVDELCYLDFLFNIN